MFCPQCGTKLKEGAKFCSECGTRVVSSSVSKNEEQGVVGDVAPGQARGDLPRSAFAFAADALLPQDEGPEASSEIKGTPKVQRAEAGMATSKKTTLGSLLMQTRRVGSLAVPTFALIIAAIVASVGVACAAYRVVTEVVIPALEQQAEESNQGDAAEGESSEDEAAADKTTEEQYALYQEVIDQARACLTNGDYEDYYDTETGKNTKYPLINEEIGIILPYSYSIETFYYVYIDLDGNGVMELLIGCAADDAASASENIVGGYSFDAPADSAGADDLGGGLHQFLYSWDRNAYALCEGGIFENYGNGGYLTYGYNWSKYSKGSFDYIEWVDCTWVSGDAQSGDVVIEITHKVADETVQDVTEAAPSDGGPSETYLSLLEEVSAKYPVDTSIEWTPLSQ